MTIFNTFISSFVILLVSLANVEADQLALPKSDVTAPVIIHKPLSKSIQAGSFFQLKVIARDDQGIKKVVVYYRKVDDEDFKTKIMRSAGNDEFITDFTAAELSAPGLEYYVQAEDLSGNTLLHGYSFSPMLVQIEKADTKPIAAVTKPEEIKLNKLSSKNTPWYKNKWLWVGAGVLTAATATAVIVSGNDEPTTTIQFSLPPLQ